MSLSRREIEQRDQREIEIEIPAWQGTVMLRRLNALQLQEVMAITEEANGDAELLFFVELSARSIVSNGRLEFDDEDGRTFLRGVDMDTMNRLQDAALALNGLADDGEPSKKN